MQKKLQVFVSSTYRDLLSERQAAVEAILQAGHIPAGMELFAAGDRSQWDTIRRWIDDCDVFMLILGGRYGSLEPESGKSYVELEYRYATEQSKPTFAVVISEACLENKVKSQGASVLETENASALKDFRGLVLSRVCRIFEDTKDVKLAVHESMLAHARRPEVIGWVPASSVTNNLAWTEERAKLIGENSQLKDRILALESDVLGLQSRTATEPELDRVVQFLDSVKLRTTLTVNGEKKTYEFTVLQWFVRMSDTFTSGVSNRYDVPELERFLHDVVAPKLMVHELVEEMKANAMATFSRRRSSARGRRLIARYQLESNRKQTSKVGGQQVE